MSEQSNGWAEIISNNDSEALWTRLFKLVSRHSSIRSLVNSGRVTHDRLQDMYCDITQDLFLKLHKKGRWEHYRTAGYTHADVEHELYHIEIPNLVSLILRERHPEAYRMARRISNLLQTRPEFQRYRRPAVPGQSERRGKLTLKVYGLAQWPEDKALKPHQTMSEMAIEVPCRGRDRRRAGRGSSSQIIISNSDLTQLLIEVLTAIDSPADIRMLRALVLSKLPIEDSRFVSIDAALAPDGVSDPEPIKVDLTDHRPTPEQVLLENESRHQVEQIAVELLVKMRQVVRNKPGRYSRLARVAWHCYFDRTSPSQTSIAKQIGISNSLVSHYRKLFDTVIRDVQLDAGQYTSFLHAFIAGLEKSISETGSARNRPSAEPKAEKPDIPAPRRYHVAMAAVATRFC
jgi:hypothetical protein